MKNLFNKSDFNAILQRLNALDGTEKLQWGTMTESQMLQHCRLQLDMALKLVLAKDIFPAPIQWLTKQTMGFRIPWPKNLVAAPEMKVTENAEFSSERELLLQRILEMQGKHDFGSHPFFGKMSKEDWGKIAYKHLDYHLRQFGS